MPSSQKQPSLKPQDVVVALKIALASSNGSSDASGDASSERPSGAPSYAHLAKSLFMSASEAHAAVQRAITSRLLAQSSAGLVANRAALQEFLLHGLMYSFPGVEGPITRGMPTGAAAPHFSALFDQTQSLAWVWPDALGEMRGPSLSPLYPNVPAACRLDDNLYRMLSALDALRAGAAREREIAQREVLRQLS
jgi:hypothetical protein